MEKRIILAIALSSLVLLFWSLVAPRPVAKVPLPSVNPPQVNNIPPAQSITEKESPVALINFSTDKLEVVFDENQAAIKEVSFKAYQNYNFSLYQGLKLGSDLAFKKEKTWPDGVSFVYKDENKEIVKRFIFSKYSYAIDLEVSVSNLSNVPQKLNLPLILGTLDFIKDPVQSRYQDFTVALPEKIIHPNSLKESYFNQLKFIGLRDRYFCAMVNSNDQLQAGFIRKIDAKRADIGLSGQDLLLLPTQKIEQKFHIYLGPQQLKLINAVNPEWAAIIHYGTFDFISQILLQLLEVFHRLVHNWGWAIIILSLAIYFVLYPLTLKQMRSMKEMQALQPRMEELRKTYKDNPQKLNKEIMELYREHKVNPFGGCLPLILQMPIFFALYQALMRSIALKGAKFFWIRDLSEPDRLFILPTSLPVLGNEINILPILMMIGMFFQQKISAAASSGVSKEQQKMMLIIFPLMFGFIFYRMPSGLVLYWFVNSGLMLLTQLKASRSK